MPTFPRNYWDPDFHGYVYLIEFFATEKWARATQPAAPPNLEATLREEIPQILAKKAERKERLSDIQFQATTSFFSTLFPRRLMFSIGSHPATFEVLRVAVLLGRAVAMYFKDEFKRVRPSQLSAEVNPVIDVPGHPAYPSGHSTQAHLIAHLLGALHPSRRDPKWESEILQLAADVARNREVAGVHYESDSKAGRKLAGDIAKILLDKKKCPKFQELLERAKREWV